MHRITLGLLGSALLAVFALCSCGGKGPETTASGLSPGLAAPAARPTPTRPPDEAPDNPIVAQVGGETIRLAEIMELERGVRFGPPPPGRSWREVVLEFRAAKLDDLVLDKAILWKMEQAGLRSRVESEVARTVAARGEEELRQRGLTLPAYTVLVAKYMLQEEDLKQLPQVSETEMRNYYEQHKTDLFLTPEALSVRRIFRAPRPGQDREALRAEMEALRRDILEQFESAHEVHERATIVSTFARERHEGPDKGGWIKHYRPGPTSESEDYLDAAFNAELYALSPVLEVDGGFLLLYPDSRYGRIQQSYEKSRSTIHNMLVKERKETFQERWKKRLLAEADAAVYAEYLDRHLPPESAPEAPAVPEGG